MKPNHQRILNAVPAAIFLAILALWWFSRHQPRVLLVRGFGGHGMVAASDDRAVFLLDAKAGFEGVVGVSGEMQSYAALSMTQAEFHDAAGALLGESRGHVARAGFHMAVGPKAGSSLVGMKHFFLIAFPYWMLLIVAGMGMAPPIRRGLIRWRRKRKGLCQICGYDLRMSPGRCPECGAGVANAKSSGQAARTLDVS